MLTLSQKECDRLVILTQVHQGQLTVSDGARRARLGLRYFRRLLRRFQAEGDKVVAHALRGRPSNHRLPTQLREDALRKARDPVYDDFGPTLLSEHLERDARVGPVNPHTLRRWMIEESLWTPKRRRRRHRKRRERRSAPGELLLMDTSIHRWLEGRSSEEIVLIALIDDATSRLQARFFPRDTGAANRQMLVDYLLAHGRMAALYVDGASHFRAHGKRANRNEQDLEAGITIIQRGLDALEIELIVALSPQAKGRVERLFKTLQDRLIKEMRVAQIACLVEANRFLDEVFIPFWDRRFAVEPRLSCDAHRPLPQGADLLRLFAKHEFRVIREDFTFRFKNQHFQIEKSQSDPGMPSRQVVIELRLDGSTCYRWEDIDLIPTPLDARPSPPAESPKRIASPSSKPMRPAPTHPWRQYLKRFEGPRPTTVEVSASLRPNTPKPGDFFTTSL